MDTSPGLGLERIDTAAGVTIRVVAETSQETELLMFCLEYDADMYSLAETATGEFTGTKDCLTLSATPRPGYVCFGQVRQGGGVFDLAAGEFLAEVHFAAHAEATTKVVSGVPTCDRARTQLSFNAATSELKFHLSNPGDYDQNGLVSVSDLAPIGQHYGKTGPFEYSSMLSVVDGNQNDLIEIGDITIIGQNWSNAVELYNFYRSGHIEDYPEENSATSTITRRGTLDFSEVCGNPAEDRLWFVIEIESPTGNESYWVRPAVYRFGAFTEGTPSDVFTYTNWTMAGHDAQHTSRSNAIGPQTSELAWSYSFAVAGSTPPAFGPDGTVYVGSDQGKLYAVDAGGNINWVFRAEGDEFAPPVCGPDGTVYSGNSDGNLYAVNPDGSLDWSFQTGGSIIAAAALADDGTVYTGNTAGKYCAISSTGALLWAYMAGDIQRQPVAGSDGRSYVISENLNLYALSSAGGPDWIDPLSGEQLTAQLHLTVDGNLLFGVDGQLQCVSPDREECWSYDLGVEQYSDPVMLPDGTILVSTGDNRLLAISPSGELVWSRPTTVWYYSLVVDPDRDLIYAFSPGEIAVHDFNGNLIDAQWQTGVAAGYPAIDAGGDVFITIPNDGLRSFSTGGAALWTVPATQTLDYILATADGNLYCTGSGSTASGETYWVKSFSSSGELLWTYDLPARVYVCPAINCKGIFFCLCINGDLNALSLNGELLWTRSLDVTIAADMVVAPDGILYFPWTNVWLLAYNCEGERLWRESTGQDVIHAPAVGADGKIYLCSKSQELYSFDADGNVIFRRRTDWPLYQSPTIARDRTIYYGNRNIYAVRADGSVRWSVDLGLVSLSSSISIGTDDSLICLCNDNTLRSYDYLGNELPDRELEIITDHTPVVGGDGTVYLESQGTIMAVDLVSGQELWSDHPADGCTTELVIGPEGQLYLGCDDSVLYAYRGPE